MTAKTYRLIKNKPYLIFVDNHKAESYNINIDYPTWFCFALTPQEAVRKMKISDFEHKEKQVTRISCLN